jgi:hypothetical protein
MGMFNSIYPRNSNSDETRRYAIKHCLWKPEGTFPAIPLIERFYRAAERDGIDSQYLQSPESENETVLLREAGQYNASWEDNNA